MATRPWVSGLGPCMDIEKVSFVKEKDYAKILLNPGSPYSFDIYLYSPANKEVEFDMPFTKQHFEIAAQVLRDVDIEETDKQTLYLAFSKKFSTLNPNFDSDRFFHSIFPKNKQETSK